MSTVEIPLSGQPQTFLITLNGVQYRMTVTMCEPASCWCLDIADNQNNPLAMGIAIVTGRDLLEGLGYLGIGGGLFASTDHDPAAVPTFANLGTLGHLYFYTADG